MVKDVIFEFCAATVSFTTTTSCKPTTTTRTMPSPKQQQQQLNPQRNNKNNNKNHHHLHLHHHHHHVTATRVVQTKRRQRQALLGLVDDDDDDCGCDNNNIHLSQACHAATIPAQSAVHATLCDEFLAQIPSSLWKATVAISASTQSAVHAATKAFGFNHNQETTTNHSCTSNRQETNQETSSSSSAAASPPLLYQHQVTAIQACMMSGRHTAICTGTGSGKSLCFLLPALLLFPTKALAQDQLPKLTALLERMNYHDDTNTDCQEPHSPNHVGW